MKAFGDGFDCVIFPRLSMSWRKLQLSPFEHYPLDSHCQQSPRILCIRFSCHLILDHGISFIISISGARILISYLMLDTSLHQSSICDNQVMFSCDKSPGHTMQLQSWVSQTLVFLMCTILPRCHQVGFSSWTIELRPTLNEFLNIITFRRLKVNRSATFSTESMDLVTRKYSLSR